MPLRDFAGMTETMLSVVRDYDRAARRIGKKDEDHLCKHAMHLIRLLMTGTDILERHEIITYRESERPILMRIRNGGFLCADGTFSPEFYDMLEQYQRRFNEAAERTTLPDQPDMAKVGALAESVNRFAIWL